MIDKIEDFDFTEKQTLEEIAVIVKEKLGVSFPEMAELLSTYLDEKADEIAKNYVTVIPYGDYGKLLEGDVKIAHFFRTEATKPESWVPFKLYVSQDPKQPKMIEVAFDNIAVDEGDSIKGYVFISFAGVIRHAFVIGDP
jgi:predicted HTH domain antitoxin